ncbi:MAG: hypothetical protein R6U26_02680 [Candidatus Undinarchaeales archaeon]
MNNKAIAVLAAFILIIIGLLIANYLCSECLFGFPEFEGGSTGGGGVSIPSQPAEDTSGGGFASLFVILIILLIAGFLLKKKFWPPKRPGEQPEEPSEPPEEPEEPEEPREPEEPEEPPEDGPGWKEKRNYPLIPREILGKWRKEIVEKEKYCKKVGSFNKNFSKFVKKRMNKAPYPTYLLFKGWIDSSKAGNDRFHLGYAHDFCRKLTYKFEGYLRDGLEEALSGHGTISGGLQNVTNVFLKRMVEAYAWVDKDGVKIKEINDKTKQLLEVFLKFGGQERDVFEQINSTREKMDAEPLKPKLWAKVQEILHEGSFKSKANELEKTFDSVENQIKQLLALMAELKGTRGSWRDALQETGFSELIDDTSTTIDSGIKEFEELMTNVKGILDNKIDKKSSEHEQVLIILDEIFGPPLRIMIGRIGLLALIRRYVELKKDPNSNF